MPSRTNRSKHEVVHQRGRSRVTNGKQLFLDPNVDQRTGISRRYRDVLAQLVAQCGGADAMSESEMILARRAATLVVFCEQHESTMASTGKLAIADYLPAVGVLKRMLETLGVKRRPREVNGAVLHDYVQANASRAVKAERLTVEPEEPRPARRINEAVAAIAGGGAAARMGSETPAVVRVRSRKVVEHPA